ncbi:Aste57867_4879 [Aphanomyces stellatus]|uniref:Aste57867_4879 protein n=1 Tax=Aphanomyces stellatus TaxID=120398 RepID=A0A485KG23_9STRA|nr:hypothetical protein As57867_004866 [Aphanomyces stellatus]VFT81971.1 Aste57867_4879 [Aphanomyces stellatus]
MSVVPRTPAVEPRGKASSRGRKAPSSTRAASRRRKPSRASVALATIRRVAALSAYPIGPTVVDNESLRLKLGAQILATTLPSENVGDCVHFKRKCQWFKKGYKERRRITLPSDSVRSIEVHSVYNLPHRAMSLLRTTFWGGPGQCR